MDNMLLIWLLLWAVFTVIGVIYKQSLIISIGGGFIASVITLIIISVTHELTSNISNYKGHIGIAALISAILFGALAPRAPKKDGRFKTGLKDNARMPTQSKITKQLQGFFIITCALSAITYLFI
jgi:hypothetical protein